MRLNQLQIVCLVILCLFISCKDLQDNKTYYFPAKMNTISNTEIDPMCNKVFYLTNSYVDDENLKNIKFDSIIFKKNGTIYSSNLKVGTWEKDRNIYLSNYKLKFFFNSISNNTLKITSRYTIDNDTILRQIRLRLESKFKQTKN